MREGVFAAANTPFIVVHLIGPLTQVPWGAGRWPGGPGGIGGRAGRAGGNVTWPQEILGLGRVSQPSVLIHQSSALIGDGTVVIELAMPRWSATRSCITSSSGPLHEPA